jgi:hypothetical protein
LINAKQLPKRSILNHTLYPIHLMLASIFFIFQAS